jgi:pheromone shutdown protein TraB
LFGVISDNKNFIFQILNNKLKIMKIIAVIGAGTMGGIAHTFAQSGLP